MNTDVAISFLIASATTICRSLRATLADGSRSSSRPIRSCENAALKPQLAILQRKQHNRIQLTNDDRFFLVQLSVVSIDPEDDDGPPVLQLETLVRWHARVSVAIGTENPGVAEGGHRSRWIAVVDPAHEPDFDAEAIALFAKSHVVDSAAKS